MLAVGSRRGEEVGEVVDGDITGLFWKREGVQAGKVVYNFKGAADVAEMHALKSR
jgi:hypothetical protein